MNVTKQQVFDAAWNGLKGQGFVQSRSSGPLHQCAYRNERGFGCAVGHLLTDAEVAVLGVEVNSSVSGLMSVGLLPDRLVPHAEFLASMQGCHDDGEVPADMECRLREFAKERGLSIPDDPKPIPTVAERIAEVVGGPSALTPDEQLAASFQGAMDRDSYSEVMPISAEAWNRITRPR